MSVSVFQDDMVCVSLCCRMISSVSNQNGVFLLYIMLEIHHSGQEPSNYGVSVAVFQDMVCLSLCCRVVWCVWCCVSG